MMVVLGSHAMHNDDQVDFYLKKWMMVMNVIMEQVTFGYDE